MPHPYTGSVWYATQPRAPLKKEVRIAITRAYFNGCPLWRDRDRRQSAGAVPNLLSRRIKGALRPIQ